MADEATTQATATTPSQTDTTTTPAATEAATTATPVKSARDAFAERKERLANWGKKDPPKDPTPEANKRGEGAPDSAKTAVPTPADSASTAKDAAASGSPAEDAKPKEDGYDLITKLAKERRAWELEKQSFQKERDLHKSELELAGRYKAIPQLLEAKDYKGLMQLVHGENWRDAWFELTTSIAPEPVEPLTPEQAKELARKEYEALREAETKKLKEESDARIQRGYDRYRDACKDLAEKSGKYPSVVARGSLSDQPRLNQILQEEYSKTGNVPDTQVVLERLESEDRAYFLKHLPYVASALQAASAPQTSEVKSTPVTTLTPEMKQGALPPSDPPAPRNARESLEQRKARLRKLQQEAA